MQDLPTLEIYNSKFTSKYGQWALGFCGDVYDKNNPGFGNLQDDSSLHTITSLDLSDRGIHNLNNKVLTFVTHFDCYFINGNFNYVH